MAICKTKQSRNRHLAPWKGDSIRLVRRKPFVTGMLGQDRQLETDFPRRQKTLQLRAQGAGNVPVQDFNPGPKL